MATWKISNYYKKNCVEVQTWTKDGVSFTYSEGFRWGTFTKEDDDKPNIDLNNPDGFDPYWDDWELDMMDDGCWADFEFPDSFTDEERAEIERIWEEDGYSGLEEAGWCNDETDVQLSGPLLLVNDDTGDEWHGEEQ